MNDEFRRMTDDPLTMSALRKMGISVKGERVSWFIRPEGVVDTRELERRYEASFQAENPDLKPLPLPPGESLYKFQLVGAHEILRRKKILLADDMGLGKTVQTIAVTNADETIRTVLVVCPRAVKENWKREFEKFGFRLNTEIVIISGQKKATVRPMARKLDGKPKGLRVVIVNYDVVPFWEHILKLPEWDMIVLDEAHEIKNYESKRSAIIAGGKVQDFPAAKAKQLREQANKLEEAARRARLDRDPGKALRLKEKAQEILKEIPKPRVSSGIDARYKIALSGTPFENRVSELIPALAWLDAIGKDRPLGTAWSYVQRYAGGDADSRKIFHAEELARKLRENIMVRRLKREVLKELPKKTRTIIEIPTTNKELLAQEAEAFRRMESKIEGLKLAVDLARFSHSDKAHRQAVKDLREGRKVSIEEMAEIRLETAKEKIPFAISHLKTFREPVIVFAHHRVLLTRLEKALTDSGRACGMVIGQQSDKRRQEAIDEFQAGNLDFILCSMRAASVGLTLTASCKVVFLEYDWTESKMTQAEDRAYRIGQKNDVEVQLLVLSKSFDARMAKVVCQKAELAERILNSRDNLKEASNLEDDELEERYLERKSKALARRKTYTVAQRDVLGEGIRRLQDRYDALLGKTTHRRAPVVSEADAPTVELLCWKWRKILGDRFLFWNEGKKP